MIHRDLNIMTTAARRAAAVKITLYTHFWKEKEEGRDPTVEWKFLEKNIPLFNPVTGICRLCTREKFNILLNPTQATLN